MDRPQFRCYQCDELCNYLFRDGRCKDCTRVMPDEVIQQHHESSWRDYVEEHE